MRVCASSERLYALRTSAASITPRGCLKASTHPGRREERGHSMTRRFETKFGSLEHYEKGAVEVIDDDAKHYTFSNVFEVASQSRPYEKVAVGQNRQYVLEAVRAEGTSE